jgi:hypothetical protein
MPNYNQSDADKVAQQLRNAYGIRRAEDFRYINRHLKEVKDVTDFKQNRKDYNTAVRLSKEWDPEGFQTVQDRNTDAKLRVLNAIDFDRDPYEQDPISKKAFEDLQYKVDVPLGYQGDDGKAYTLPGQAMASTRRPDPEDPEAGYVHVSSGATLPEMQENRMGLPALLRHEGHHSYNFDAEHDAIYGLDRIYQQKHKGTDATLRNPRYEKDPPKHAWMALVDEARQAVRGDRSLGDPSAIPEGLPAEAKWSDLNKLKPEEQLKVLRSADEYQLLGRGLSRDLPEESWLDSLTSMLK